MTNEVDAELTRFYYDEGLNIIAFDKNKKPIGPDGKGLTGTVLNKRQDEIPQYVLESERWGVRPSTDPKSNNIIFLDWDDAGKKPPQEIKLLFQAYRKRDGGESLHGIVRFVDADAKWCREFADLVTHILKKGDPQNAS